MSELMISITRKDCYRADGSHRHFVYSYTAPDAPTLRGATYKPGINVEYGTGLTELRSMLKRKFGPAVRFDEAWKK